MLWWYHFATYKCSSPHMLHTLNLCNVICSLFPSRARRENKVRDRGKGRCCSRFRSKYFPRKKQKQKKKQTFFISVHVINLDEVI